MYLTVSEVLGVESQIIALCYGRALADWRWKAIRLENRIVG
jgi:hypothetical protein